MLTNLGVCKMMGMFGKIAKAIRGRTQAYHITKVTGHATDQQVAQGLVPLDQK